MRSLGNITKPTGSILLVCGVAAAVRLLYLGELSNAPWFEFLIRDEMRFAGEARWIAAGQSPVESTVYVQPPVYSYFLGLVFSLFGHDVGLARGIQLAIGVVNSLLVYLVARRVFGGRIALMSGLVFATYGPMLFFEGCLLKSVLVVFFNLVFLISLLRCFESPSCLRGLSSGALLGVAAITQPIALPFGLVLGVCWLAHLRGAAKPKRIQVALSFALGVSLVVGMVAARNRIVGGEHVLITSTTGINLFLGVGPNFEEKTSLGPLLFWQLLGRAGHDWKNSEGENNKILIRHSLQIIARNPWRHLANTVKKLLHFSNGNERARNQSLYATREYSRLLSVLLWKNVVGFPFGVLFPFAVLGLIFAMVQGSVGARLMGLFCVTHIAVLALFFVTARLRMNILPFLIIFAVYGGAWLIQQWRNRQWVTAGSCSGALGLLLLLCNWNIGPMVRHFAPDIYLTVGAQRGSEDGCAWIKEAVRLDKSFAKLPAALNCQ